MLGCLHAFHTSFPCHTHNQVDCWCLSLHGLKYLPKFSILPALAFSLDMFEKTSQSFGVNEVLLASVLGSVVFSFFAAQPLVIVGVTGLYFPEIEEHFNLPYRSHHCLQLYRLRYHFSSRNQLLRLHVLDRNVRAASYLSFKRLIRLDGHLSCIGA